LGLAEMNNVLPPAGKQQEEHTKNLLEQIKKDGLYRAHFLKVCKDNGWTDADAIEGITAEEISQLTDNWPQVVEEVRKIMPGPQQ